MNNKTVRTLLTGLSCAGVVATMICTRQCSIKADEIRRKEKLVDPKTIVKRTSPYYIPAIICGGGTIAFILLNQYLTAKYVAAIVSAAGASTRFFHEFETKAREMLGDMKVDEIHRAIAEDHEKGIVNAAVPQLYAPGLLSCVADPKIEGNLLFYDEFTDIWFRSSFAAVKNAEYHLNRNFVLGADISLEEFYDFLGVGLPKEFRELRWGDVLLADGICWLDFHHLDAFSKDKNEHYIIIRYDYDPVLELEDRYDIINDGVFNSFFVKR